MHFEKTSPNSMRLVGHAGKKSLPAASDGPDGLLNIKMPEVAKATDPVITARAIAKIALGVMTIERGRDYVLESRFDPLRRFALEGGRFENVLMLLKDTKPQKGGHFEWHEGSDGIVFACQILGARFVLGLLPNELKPPTPRMETPEAYVFDLRRKWDPKTNMPIPEMDGG